MSAAYEHNGAPCTRAQFYAIACDPRRHVAVEACAGAGKTWMLVSRILRALLDGAAPQEILAITFTKKAAGEMRQRLQQWLAEFARATPEQLDQELISRGIDPTSAPIKREQLQNLYRHLLAQPRGLQIRTFHSWFAALLGSAPLQVLTELGLPAAYELLEDSADAVAETWRRFLATVAADEGLRADYAAVVALLGRTRAHQALEAALDKRVEFALADAAGHVDEAVAAFDQHTPRLAGVAEPADWLLLREPGRQLLQAAAQALAPLTPSHAAQGVALVQALQAGDWDAVVAALFTQKGAPRKFNDKAAGIADIRAAQAEVEAVLAACRQHAARLHHLRMARLTRAFMADFALLKRERGWVDMGDLERAALAMLSDPFLSGWVQQRLDARVRHLLIDEFQDTNPLQWQALHAWLASYAGAGGGPDAPSLFIVGDPKQSIYRFRRADPRVFAAAQQFIADALGGERLACDHTRRNASAVLEAVNTVMLQAQGQGELNGYRAHTTESTAADGLVAALPLIPRPDKAAPDADEATVWRDSLLTPRTELEDSLRTLECRQAARWIAAQVAAGLPTREVMVLCRKRAPLGVLQAELRALGIACEQPSEQLLGDLPAVQDVLALVDALISPGHDLALARALKSPLFGLGDDDLTRIALAAHAARAGGDGAAGWLDVLPRTELLAHDGRVLHADLMQYRQWLTSLPPHDALQAIYHHGDVLARFAAAAPAPERAHQPAQLRALLAGALQLRGGRFLTAYQWLRALRREHLPAPRHAAPEAVQLLTVHGAKGLEADCVLLLGTAADGNGRKGAPGVLIDWPGDAARPQRIAFLANENAPPPSLADLAAQEDGAQAREELNALYVAMTRARRQLVISGVVPHKPPAFSWWPRIEPVAVALPAPLVPAVPAAPATAPGQPAQPFFMLELPHVRVDQARAAIKHIVINEPDERPASDAARIGEAMHWLLEHAGDGPAGWRPERVAQIERRHSLSPAQAAQAHALAQRIFTGEAAWAWDGGEVLEAFDEVELIHQGQRLRIDRLVRRRAGTHGPEAWWVLDYKSAAQPERDEALALQLTRYRAAIERLHPGQAVRVAFLSGEGRVVG